MSINYLKTCNESTQKFYIFLLKLALEKVLMLTQVPDNYLIKQED